MRGRLTLRRLMRGPALGLLALVVLAAAGVATAALLRPSLDSSSAAPKRAAATGVGKRQQPISLNDMQRPAGASADGRMSDPPAKATSVIGVGTGEFSGQASASGTSTGSAGSSDPAIEDVDGSDPSQMKAASDSEIRSELAAFRDRVDGLDPRDAARGAYIDKDGQAHLPKGAPRAVAAVVAAANEIAKTPYKWGGGHGAWKDSGYDCSGSVSFALAGARLLNHPLDSSGLMHFGKPGPGRWITIYANPGHVFMTVAGLRFDTSGQSSAGTRWQRGSRPTGGYAVRHPRGL